MTDRPSVTLTPPPSAVDAQERIRETRRRFHRTLGSWASDLLILRQRSVSTLRYRPDEAAWRHAA